MSDGFLCCLFIDVSSDLWPWEGVKVSILDVVAVYLGQK